jgi:hypothetical protein
MYVSTADGIKQSEATRGPALVGFYGIMTPTHARSCQTCRERWGRFCQNPEVHLLPPRLPPEGLAIRIGWMWCRGRHWKEQS